MIQYTHKALKDMKKLNKQTVSKIRAGVQRLDSKPMQGDIKALQGEYKGLYRLRIGNYRVIFKVEDGTITIITILDRKGAY